MTATLTPRDRSPDPVSGSPAPHPHRPHEGVGHDVTKAGENLVVRVGIAAGGLILVAVGIGLGVSVVLLPLGIPLGLVGLALLYGGLFYRDRGTKGDQ